jgi:hypothetical protein
MSAPPSKLRSLKLVAVWGLAAAFVFHSPRAGLAQQAVGKLRGVVVDWQYARILGTKIVFESKSFKKVMFVDSEGAYEIGLPAGTYLVTATDEGFVPRRFKFQVEPATTKTLNMILDVTPTKPSRCPRRLAPCIQL